MKICGKCKENKPFTEYHRFRDRYQAYCKSCRKAIDAKAYSDNKQKRYQQNLANRKRVQEEIRALKESMPCVDCGGMFHFAAMQWDHLPGSKKVADVSSFANRGMLSKALDEIKKCELVCANCHAVRTYNRLV